MTGLEFQNEATRWIAALANSAPVGAAAVIAAWGVTRLRLSAASRYVVWWTALTIVVLTPVTVMFPFDRETAPPPARAANLASPVEVEMVPSAPRETRLVGTVIPPEPHRVQNEPILRLPLHLAANPLSAWLAALWLMAMCCGLARLAAEFLQLRRARRQLAPAEPILAARLAEWMRCTGTHRRLRLAVSDAVRAPAVFGVFDPVIVLPRSLTVELTPAELDHILLHEVAHMRRRDDWARLVQRCVETLFCFHPAVLWAGRKLDLEREIACDDWSIAVTGQAREYASSLARVVELTGFRRRWALASGAAEKKSHLVKRIEHMLDQKTNRAPRASRLALVAVMAVVAVSLLGAVYAPAVLAFVPADEQDVQPPPTPPAPPAQPTPAPKYTPPAPPAPARAALTPIPDPAPPPPPPPPGSSRQVSIRSRTNGRGFDLKMGGFVEFTDDDSDVKSITPDGYFIFDSDAGPERKRYEVRADSEGKLTRTYLVNGARRDPGEARPWLAGALPEIISESGIEAGPRIQRILQRGGNPAAFREIGLIKSDGSKATYLLELLNRARLDDAGLSSTMRLVRTISSNGDRARVLIAAVPNYSRAGLREPFYEAVDSMSSDGDRRRVLMNALKADREAAPLAVRSAGRLSSDGDKAAVLIEASPGLDNAEMRRAWFRAADTLSSDGDRARTLVNVIDRNRNAAVHADAARSAAHMSSDGDKARVLVRLTQEDLSDPTARTAFFEAANSIRSDGDRARVLVSALNRSGASTDWAVNAIQSAGMMSSDGDKARVLVQAAQQFGRNAQVDQAIRAALKTMSSDGDRRRVSSLLDKSFGQTI